MELTEDELELVRNKLATGRLQDLGDVSRMTTGDDARITSTKPNKAQRKRVK